MVLKKCYQENKHLNYKYYWGYGDMGTSKFTIHDYLKTFNDKSLLELEGWNNDPEKNTQVKKVIKFLMN